MAVEPSCSIDARFDALIRRSYQGALTFLQQKDVQEDIDIIVRNFTSLTLAKWQGLSSRPPLDGLRRDITAKVIQHYGDRIEVCLAYFNEADQVALFQYDPRNYRHLLDLKEEVLFLNNKQLSFEQLVDLLSRIPESDRLAIRKLDISNTSIQSLAPILELFPNLETCVANQCGMLTDLGLSRPIPTMRSLQLANNNKLRDLTSIQSLANLQELDVSGCRLLVNVDEVASLPLKSLKLRACNSIKAFEFLSSLRDIEFLDLSHLARFNATVLQLLRTLFHLSKVVVSDTGVSPPDIETFPAKEIFCFFVPKKH